MSLTRIDGDVNLGLATLHQWRVEQYATNADMNADAASSSARIAYVTTPDAGMSNWYVGFGGSWSEIDTSSEVLIPFGTISPSTSAGIQGQMSVDASYIYVCVSTNSWMRAALSSY
jgi:hypothetical protein